METTYLKRKIDDFLLKWKEDENRKPLIVKGCRQIGKTESIRHFTKIAGYESFIEINFVKDEKYKKITVDGAQKNNCGGFIGMITSCREGDTERFGTIRNVAFTRTMHGRFGLKGKDNTTHWFGNNGGFLYSVLHNGEIENVYMDFYILGGGSAVGNEDVLETIRIDY